MLIQILAEQAVRFVNNPSGRLVHQTQHDCGRVPAGCYARKAPGMVLA